MDARQTEKWMSRWAALKKREYRKNGYGGKDCTCNAAVQAAGGFSPVRWTDVLAD
jgi:hypothetical protein